MFVALNPAKIQRFTTQGLNLTLNRPVGFVVPDISPACKTRIDEALANQELFEVPDDVARAGMEVKNQGGITKIDHQDEKKVGSMHPVYEMDEVTGQWRIAAWEYQFDGEPASGIQPSPNRQISLSLVQDEPLETPQIIIAEG